MSFKESYLVPKAHFERLLAGKIGKIENVKKKISINSRRPELITDITPKLLCLERTLIMQYLLLMRC